jgi:hypothetical protein
MINLKPRNVTRWCGGNSVTEPCVIPKPFGQERAEKIWQQRRMQGEVQHAMTDREIAYVDAVWETMSGGSSWFGAFCEIKNRGDQILEMEVSHES